MKALARELRRHGTDAERALWRRLRCRQLLGHKFRREEIIGPYIADFVCVESRVIVEVDGGHHMEQQGRDERRSVYLRCLGYRVMRFWNNEVLVDIDGVLERIRMALEEGRS